MFGMKDKRKITLLDAIKDETNYTLTENGALTYASSLSDCVDLFGTIGAIRNADENDIIDRFMRAYCEDADIAMKILFYARDIREGLGERKVFKTILKYLADNKKESVIKNLDKIAEYGRYDDIFVLIGTECEKEALAYIAELFMADIAAAKRGDEVSLLGKWMASVNTSNKETVALAKTFARYCKMTDAEYRKNLTMLREKIKIIENNLREKDYTFDYEKQASRALFKYRKAFERNDNERYTEFLDNVSKGTVKMNTGNVTAYDIVNKLINIQGWSYGVKKLSALELKALDTTWNALTDIENDENVLAVVDGSGSMYNGGGTAAKVAFALGLYFAERNKGMFNNYFMTFSERAKLVEIKGATIADKLRYIMGYNEIANTNLESVFTTILNAAKRNGIKKEEMVSKIVIISDMEFDYCAKNADMTNFENARKMFNDAGYELCDVVFWNVNSRNRQQAVRYNDQGVCLVSGYTEKLFNMVTGKIDNAYEIMMKTVGGERYQKIVA